MPKSQFSVGYKAFLSVLIAARKEAGLTQTDLAERIGKRQTHISIIETAAVPIGMIQAFDGADAVEVGEIQILPAYQNHGIGRQVLQEVIDTAHNRGKGVVLSLGLKNEGGVE